jgi:N-methylhydantoinase A/oxoprolinase/acetone carboxylase beta subunit
VLAGAEAERTTGDHAQDESGDRVGDSAVLADGLQPGQVAAAVRRIATAAEGTVLVRLRATCRVPKPGLPALSAADAPPGGARTGSRTVLLPAGRREVQVYARDRLRAGHELTGPCVIESPGSTYLIPAGASCRIDGFGTAILTTP